MKLTNVALVVALLAAPAAGKTSEATTVNLPHVEGVEGDFVWTILQNVKDRLDRRSVGGRKIVVLERRATSTLHPDILERLERVRGGAEPGGSLEGIEESFGSASLIHVEWLGQRVLFRYERTAPRPRNAKPGWIPNIMGVERTDPQSGKVWIDASPFCYHDGRWYQLLAVGEMTNPTNPEEYARNFGLTAEEAVGLGQPPPPPDLPQAKAQHPHRRLITLTATGLGIVLFLMMMLVVRARTRALSPALPRGHRETPAALIVEQSPIFDVGREERILELTIRTREELDRALLLAAWEPNQTTGARTALQNLVGPLLMRVAVAWALPPDEEEVQALLQEAKATGNDVAAAIRRRVADDERREVERQLPDALRRVETVQATADSVAAAIVKYRGAWCASVRELCQRAGQLHSRLKKRPSLETMAQLLDALARLEREATARQQEYPGKQQALAETAAILTVLNETVRQLHAGSIPTPSLRTTIKSIAGGVEALLGHIASGEAFDQPAERLLAAAHDLEKRVAAAAETHRLEEAGAARVEDELGAVRILVQDLLEAAGANRRQRDSRNYACATTLAARVKALARDIRQGVRQPEFGGPLTRLQNLRSDVLAEDELADLSWDIRVIKRRVAPEGRWYENLTALEERIWGRRLATSNQELSAEQRPGLVSIESLAGEVREKKVELEAAVRSATVRRQFIHREVVAYLEELLGKILEGDRRRRVVVERFQLETQRFLEQLTEPIHYDTATAPDDPAQDLLRRIDEFNDRRGREQSGIVRNPGGLALGPAWARRWA